MGPPPVWGAAPFLFRLFKLRGISCKTQAGDGFPAALPLCHFRRLPTGPTAEKGERKTFRAASWSIFSFVPRWWPGITLGQQSKSSNDGALGTIFGSGDPLWPDLRQDGRGIVGQTQILAIPPSRAFLRAAGASLGGNPRVASRESALAFLLQNGLCAFARPSHPLGHLKRAAAGPLAAKSIRLIGFGPLQAPFGGSGRRRAGC